MLANLFSIGTDRQKLGGSPLKKRTIASVPGPAAPRVSKSDRPRSEPRASIDPGVLAAVGGLDASADTASADERLVRFAKRMAKAQRAGRASALGGKTTPEAGSADARLVAFARRMKRAGFRARGATE